MDQIVRNDIACYCIPISVRTHFILIAFLRILIAYLRKYAAYLGYCLPIVKHAPNLRRPLSYNRVHSLISMHAQTNKVIIHKKSSDPLNLPMIPKFSNKESSMTPENFGLAETLLAVREISIWQKDNKLRVS